MSLRGKRVVVTRATHQAASLVQRLHDYDALPVLYPCIDIAPVTDNLTFDAALREIAAYDWLLITSKNTVYALEQRLAQLGIAPDWSQIRIAAVGQATARKAADHLGVTVDIVPDEQLASALADALPLQPDSRIFLPQSARAPHDLVNTLRQRGAQVTACTAYDNIIGSDGDDVPALLRQNAIDALTFTSSSTVENFIERIDPLPVPHALPAACIGPRTADTAQECGFEITLVPPEYTITHMVQTLNAYFNGMR